MLFNNNVYYAVNIYTHKRAQTDVSGQQKSGIPKN